MKTHHSDPDHVQKVAHFQQQKLNVHPPAISYSKKKKSKKDDKDKEDKDKDSYLKVDVPIDHTQRNSTTTEWKVPLFESGTPEDWAKWRIKFNDLERAMPLNTAAKKLSFIKSLLHGRTLAKFETTYSNSNADDEEEKFKEALNAVTKSVFNDDQHAWRREKNHVKQCLFFFEGQFSAFKERLLQRRT